MEENYFLIDGSALTAQIRQLRRAKPEFRLRKLDPSKLVGYFINSLRDLHGGSWKRATFYFPTGDELAITDYILPLDHKRPGQVRDVHFKFCGHKLKKSAAFDKFVEESVPTEFQSRFSKSEKGIDIEICCDALKLASTGRIERLFLMTNDGDFEPLCRTLKDFGANISILHLWDFASPNVDLLRASDSYDVVPHDSLDHVFEAIMIDLDPIEGQVAAAPATPLSETDASDLGAPESEKPEAEPSDLSEVSDVDLPADEVKPA